jgi:hypothetical protein
MFDFKVYKPGELYGHPNHHAILECDGVIYIVMISFACDIDASVYCKGEPLNG